MNFQNVPRGNKLIKKAIVPKLDYMASFDYEQIEYRLLAYYLHEAVGSERMVENFKAGIDPHTALAQMVMDNLGIEYDDPISDMQRQTYGKTPNFAIIYAGGKPTIKRQLANAGMPADDKTAARILKAIRDTMPEVRELQDMIADEVKYKGYIFDILGRRYRPDYFIPYHDAVRKLLNALIQGCAAGLAREAWVKIVDGCELLQLQSHPVNYVHDEFLFDATESELPVLAEYVPQWMNNETVSQVLPVTTSMGVGKTWADKEEYSV